ncbi:MAG: hypothetical protein GY765_14430 [bacterium]|nr:hypothetical protein [bacterium]
MKSGNTKYLCVLLLIPVAFCLTLYAGSGDEPEALIRGFSVRQGFVQGATLSILQCRDGYLWLGTDGGLYRYDGYNFELLFDDVRGEFNLNGQFIPALTQDKYGNIWIGTEIYGLLRYDPANETLTRVTDGTDETKSPTFIADILIGTGDDIWFGTELKGLWKLTPHQAKDGKQGNPDNSVTLTRYTTANGLSHNGVRTLAKDAAGNIWIGTQNGLNRLTPGTGEINRFLHNPDNPQSISANYIEDICVDIKNALWVGTPEGLDRIVTVQRNGKPGIEMSHFETLPGSPEGLAAGKVADLFADSAGFLWVGTWNHGLVRRDTETGTCSLFEHSSVKKNSILHNRVSALYEGTNGTMWVGTQAGLNKLNFKKKKIRCYPSVDNRIIYSVYQDKEGIIWVGSNYAGVSRIDRNLPQKSRYKHFKHTPGDINGFPFSETTDILGDSDGNLWLCTMSKGLLRMKPEDQKIGRVTRYAPESGNPNSISGQYVSKILEDRDGDLWFGTNAGVSLLTKENKEKGIFRTFQNLPAPSDIPTNTVTTFLQDRKGKIWIASAAGGLTCFDKRDESTEYFQADPQNPRTLSGNATSCLCEDNEENLWIGTVGSGLNRLDPSRKTFTLFTTADGLPSNVLWEILEDNKGNLWISSKKGISRFSPISGNCITYDLDDGFQGFEFNMASYKNKDTGEMFFGGVNGFNSFFPDSLGTNPHVPPVRITAFRLFSKKVSLKRLLAGKDRLELSYKDAMFSFEFSALDFTHPSKNRYAYKMEGLSDEWITTGADKRVASFTKLPPGDYTLRIKGSNNDGIWNEEGVALKIYISPPFWRTWWFIGLMVLLVLTAAYFFYHARVDGLADRLKCEEQLDHFLVKYNISVREKEVIKHLMQGKTRAQIEEALFISSHTVKNHTYRIYKKLGIGSKTELVALFQKSKLIIP